MASRTRHSARKGGRQPSQAGDESQENASGRKEDRRCAYCDKEFKKTEHLLRHQRSHTKERPFHCTQCGKVYSRQYDTQTGGGIAVIAYCTNMTARSDTLLRHTKLHSTKWSQPNTNSAQPPGLEFGRGPDPYPSGASNGNTGVATHLLGHGPDGLLSAISDSQPAPSNHSEALTGEIGHRLSSAALQDPPTLGVGYLNAVHDASQASPHTPYQTENHSHIQDEHLLQNSFPMALVKSRGIPPQSSGSLWDASLNLSPGPSWWIGYDFDLEALNTSVSATMDMVEPLFQPQIPFNVVQQSPRTDSLRRNYGHRKQRSTNDIVKKSWFTHLDEMELDEDINGPQTTGQMTPATEADRYGIDDNFRARVSLKLKPRTNDDPLPSVRYLVRPFPVISTVS